MPRMKHTPDILGILVAIRTQATTHRPHRTLRGALVWPGRPERTTEARSIVLNDDIERDDDCCPYQ